METQTAVTIIGKTRPNFQALIADNVVQHNVYS